MTATRTRDRLKPAPTPTLDERLALASLAMDARLDQAALAVAVNTARIPVDPLPEVTVPHLPQAATPNPYRTPIAALLHRAQTRLETDGWTRGALVDQRGQRCPIGAIRVEADSRHQADDACVLLLEAIRRDFADETIPSWNDRQTSAAPALLYLGKAAELAHTRNR